MQVSRRTIVFGAAAIAAVGIGGALSDLSKGNARGGHTPEGAPTPTPAPVPQPLVMTYYFYWYDARTRGHLQEGTLRHHPPRDPEPAWYSVEWHKKELQDMAVAGIDVVLPVFWGSGKAEDHWSVAGLPILASAWDQLRMAGLPCPAIGLFFDTSTVAWRDLTSPDGKAWFYDNFRTFFVAIPPRAWATINGAPICFLFTSDWTAAMDQGTFDHVYHRFTADFGTKPYIVREVSWDYPIVKWEQGRRVLDHSHPIHTENSYLWGGSIHGFVDRGGVAVVGPGYDDRGLPDRRGGRVTDRRDGAFYSENFRKAAQAKKPLLAIETWNELHEGSGISETIEFGRRYIDLSARLVGEYKQALKVQP